MMIAARAKIPNALLDQDALGGFGPSRQEAAIRLERLLIQARPISGLRHVEQEARPMAQAIGLREVLESRLIATCGVGGAARLEDRARLGVEDLALPARLGAGRRA